MRYKNKKMTINSIFNSIFNPTYGLDDKEKRKYYHYLVHSSVYGLDSILFGTMLIVTLGLSIAIVIYDKRPSRSELSGQITELQKEVLDMKKSQVIATSSAYTDVQVTNEIVRLGDLYKSISDTILYDADKAVTSKVIYNEQKNLESQNEKLKEDFIRLEERFYSLIVAIIGVPLVGAFVNLGVNLYRKKVIADKIDSQ